MTCIVPVDCLGTTLIGFQSYTFDFLFRISIAAKAQAPRCAGVLKGAHGAWQKSFDLRLTMAIALSLPIPSRAEMAAYSPTCLLVAHTAHQTHTDTQRKRKNGVNTTHSCNQQPPNPFGV
mmetsp:Transcript_28833/g.51769  ORF Transcript_28833/g.51769 Transcript_28833/m.51769 type:complete len:120 (-) Transcript_28833:815-1174(-)